MFVHMHIYEKKHEPVMNYKCYFLCIVISTYKRFIFCVCGWGELLENCWARLISDVLHVTSINTKKKIYNLLVLVHA